MGNNRSGMMAFAQKYADQKIRAAQMLMCQYMMDTLQMTIHQTEGWGYDRIMRLCDAWTETRKKYSPSMNPSNPEADVCQEHMDRVMRQIIRDKQDLIPFEARYPELKKYRTGRK